ncbi:ATP-binding protein [Desulfobacterales bacterium HSG17]|nr:ATP-binding protein [Desulfobacterales bacterium HSG17]
MPAIRTARQRYFLIAALMLILFSFSYAALLGFQSKLSASLEKVQAAAIIEQEILCLGKQFWKIRFWEKVVQARSHPDAEQHFGLLIESIQDRAQGFDPILFGEELCLDMQKISLLLAQYEELFNRLIQFKTEQRLNLTQITSTYQMLSSAILFSQEPELLKSLLNMHIFLDRYSNSRNNSEYQALQMVFAFVRTRVSKSAMMDNRIESYMKKFDDLIQHDFTLEKKIKEINFQFDDISGELTMLFENMSGMMEALSGIAIETGEKLRTRIQYQSYISAGITLLFLIYLIYFIAKNLVDPIRYMSGVVTQIKAGDDQARFVFKHNDEIAQLGTAFNEMLDIIHRHRNQLESLVKERTEKLLLTNKQLQQEVVRREYATIEMQKAQKAAEKANQAKSMFLANMSHEIRTPMNAILGFSEILMNQIKEPVHQNYCNNIYTSGKGLLSLVNDILDLSKIEAGKLDILIEPIIIMDLLDEVRSIFMNKFLEKNIELKIEIERFMPEILFMDEVKVRQILVNLVGNSLKFTPKGYVKIFAGYTKDRENDSNLSHLVLEVEDTGIGIPKEQQSVIFKRFKQQEGQNTKEYGGTGLGLTISSRLVEMMNGRISLESELGKGSCFKIEFSDIKFKDEKKTEIFNLVSDYKYVIFDPADIMIVDDIDYNRELIKGYLQDTSISIIDAHCGQYALDMFQMGHIPRLILMDLRMPGKDGYEITKKIKDNEKYKNIPVIACTAAAMKDDEERIKDLFDGYLRKPIGRSQLIEELKKFLPYKNKAKEQDNWKSKPPTIREPVKTSLPPELIRILENEFIPRWNTINEMFYLDEISDFTRDVKELGLKYNIELLIEYGKELYTCNQSMDIDEIGKVLEVFPDIVDKIKSSGISV